MTSPDIPEGTVTVLFTDLVESTHLNQTLGDEPPARSGATIESDGARPRRRQPGRADQGDGRRAHGRVPVGSPGDRRRPRDPGARCGACTTTVSTRRCRCGSALHTGEVIDEDGDIHGETVIIAKRIEGLAPPGGDPRLRHRPRRARHGPRRARRLRARPTLRASTPSGGCSWCRPARTTPSAGRPRPTATPRRTSAGPPSASSSTRMLEAARGGSRRDGADRRSGRPRQDPADPRDRRRSPSGSVWSCYTGNCLDMESPPPYQPDIDQLEQAARRASPEGFRAALGENAPEVAKLMPSLRQRYDDIPPSPDLDARTGTPVHAARGRASSSSERRAAGRWCSSSRTCTGPTSPRCSCCATSARRLPERAARS